MRNRFNLSGPVPFILMHVIALGAFFFPFHWSLLAVCLGSYFIRMFGVTAGYHRYFSHRTYKMGRIPQFLMALLASTTVQKGVLWWGAHHRHHHRFSDKENDLHSPIQSGFWHSHVGWILDRKNDETHWSQIQDLSKFPELRFLNQYWIIPVVAYACALTAIGGWSWLFWGFFLSTVLLWHGTFTINSLSHVYGSRRYETGDTSRNNPFFALITLGEGWHNNHHAYMSSTRQGFFWWEFDITYYCLKMLSWVGFVSELREPPLVVLEAKRINKTIPDIALDRENPVVLHA
jgi:stearoyl-CoA desaturase (delta-9 desaturase)